MPFCSLCFETFPTHLVHEVGRNVWQDRGYWTNYSPEHPRRLTCSKILCFKCHQTVCGDCLRVCECGNSYHKLCCDDGWSTKMMKCIVCYTSLCFVCPDLLPGDDSWWKRSPHQKWLSANCRICGDGHMICLIHCAQ